MKVKYGEGQPLGSVLKDLEIPYTIKNKTLFSPGVWKNKMYDAETIKRGFQQTDFTDDVISLFLDHEDRKAAKWVGRVKNIHMENDIVKGDLEVTDIQTAINLKNKARFGISPRLFVEEHNNKIHDMEFENFSIVWEPAVKTAYINNHEVNKPMSEEKQEEKNKVSLEAVKEALEQIEQEKKDTEKAEKNVDKKDEKYPYPYPYLPQSGAPTVVIAKDELEELIEKTITSAMESFKTEKNEESEDEPEEEPKKEAEEPEPEEPEEEASEESEDEPEEKSEEASEEEPEEESSEEPEEKSEESDKVEKMSAEIEKLKSELNKPDRKSVKVSDKSDMEDSDKAMLEMLKEV